jgi:outer membrane protein assembly factor BamB
MALAAAAPPGLQAQDWKLFGFDLKHSSFNPAEPAISAANIERLAPVWTTSLGAPLAAAVSLVDGTLYVGAWDGNFYAIQASDGTILWKQFTGLVPPPEDQGCFPVIGVSSQAAVVGDNVYVGGGDSAVYAFDRATGRRLWREQIADPSTGAYLWSSISSYRNALYIGVASLADCPLTRGALVRIDLDRLEPTHIRYLAPAGEVGAGVWSTPAIDEETNTVFITTGNGDQDAATGSWGATMLSLDATTLEVKSFFFLPTASLEGDIEWGSSPTLFEDSDGQPLAGATGKDGVLYVLRRGDLAPAWQAKLAVQCLSPEDGCGAISTPAFDGAQLYAGAGVADP